MTEVQRLRLARGLTTKELALMAQVSEGTIKRMELTPSERKGGIGIESACQVARSMGVEVDVLFPETVLNYTQGRPAQSGSTYNTKPVQIIAKCPVCNTQVSTRERLAGSSDCCSANLVA